MNEVLRFVVAAFELVGKSPPDWSVTIAAQLLGVVIVLLAVALVMRAIEYAFGIDPRDAIRARWPFATRAGPSSRV